MHVSGLHCLSKCFSGKLVEYVRTLCSAYNYIRYMEWICFSLVCKQDHDEHHKPHFISNHVLDEKLSHWGTRKPHHQPLSFVLPFAWQIWSHFLVSRLEIGWRLLMVSVSTLQLLIFTQCPNTAPVSVVVQPKSPLSLPWPVLLRPRCSSVLAGNHVPCAT